MEILPVLRTVGSFQETSDSGIYSAPLRPMGEFVDLYNFGSYHRIATDRSYEKKVQLEVKYFHIIIEYEFINMMRK